MVTKDKCFICGRDVEQDDSLALYVVEDDVLLCGSNCGEQYGDFLEEMKQDEQTQREESYDNH